MRRAFPQGKAKRKSPVWGIDKRWKAGIMKIRGGAAGRREPLGLLKEVTVSWGALGGYFFLLLLRNRLMIPTTKMPI